jgi:hypothetical protein
MRIWVIAAALIDMGSPAVAQSYNHDMFESGPGGLPPAAYSAPYSPLDNAVRMNPDSISPAYVPPPADYRLPTAPDDAGAMDRLDREEMLQRLRDIDENTQPQYPSTIPDPPPAYDDDEDR